MRLKASIITLITFCFLSALAAASEAPSKAEIDEAYKKELLTLGFENGVPPELNGPLGNYIHYVVVDKTVYTTSNAAQRPDGSWVKGVVPTQISEEEALVASRLSCVRAINRIRHAAGGDLSQVRKIANIRFLTASPPSFTGHSEIADACSDMMIRIFGEAVGAHTRSVMGVTSFPWDMAHKIDLIVHFK